MCCSVLLFAIPSRSPLLPLGNLHRPTSLDSIQKFLISTWGWLNVLRSSFVCLLLASTRFSNDAWHRAVLSYVIHGQGLRIHETCISGCLANAWLLVAKTLHGYYVRKNNCSNQSLLGYWKRYAGTVPQYAGRCDRLKSLGSPNYGLGGSRGLGETTMSPGLRSPSLELTERISGR